MSKYVKVWEVGPADPLGWRGKAFLCVIGIPVLLFLMTGATLAVTIIAYYSLKAWLWLIGWMVP